MAADNLGLSEKDALIAVLNTLTWQPVTRKTNGGERVYAVESSLLPEGTKIGDNVVNASYIMNLLGVAPTTVHAEGKVGFSFTSRTFATLRGQGLKAVESLIDNAEHYHGRIL